MANHSESLLLDGLAKVGAMNEAEFRTQDFPISRTLGSYAEIVSPEWATLKTSDQRTVKLKSMTLNASDAATARSHSHTGSFGDSQSQTMSWAVKAEKGKTSLKEMDRNLFDPADVMAQLIKSACINLANTVEGVAASQLATWKSQTNGASANLSGTDIGTWDSTDFVWKVAAAEKDLFFSHIATVMKSNKFNSEIDFFADGVLDSLGRRIANQGAFNADNLAYQLSGMNVMNSINLSPGTYKGLGYAIPKRTAAMLTWIPSPNRRGEKMGIYEYYQITCPYTGRPVAVHSYTNGANNSSNGGETQDVNIQWEFSYDVSFEKATLSSGANDSTIYATALLA